MVQKIKKYIKRKYFNYKNKNKNIYLHSNVIFDRAKFEGNNVVYSNTDINESKIGFGTYISYNCKIPNSRIGKYCCIASNVKIVIGQHPVKRFISVHPSFFSTKLQAGFTFVKENIFEEHKYADPIEHRRVIIGNDVWIGQDVLILEGVKIADGSIIGAGALVTKDTEPYSINVGVPARLIDFRFQEKYRQFLCTMEWWNKDQKWIEKNIRYFEDVELFYEKFLNSKG